MVDPRELLHLLDDSDDEEELPILIPPIPPIINPRYEEQHGNEVLHVVEVLLNNVERVHHIKINNYIENIVRGYIHKDFIMHFRLSRAKAYELIARFEISDIFTSLQEHAGYVPITSEKHVLSFLWFVGHESAGYRDVADRLNIDFK